MERKIIIAVIAAISLEQDTYEQFLGKVAASLIANAYHTTSAVPIGTMIQIMALWLFGRWNKVESI